MQALVSIRFTSRSKGFTLLELLVTIVIMAVLASIAAPSFRSTITNQRIRTASMDLVSQLTYARSEAIKRNGKITLTSSAGSTDWKGGWTITDPVDGTLKTQEAYRGLTITGTAASVAFDRSGRSTINNFTFDIGDSTAGSTIQHRCVTVGLTGQPAATQGSC